MHGLNMINFIIYFFVSISCAWSSHDWLPEAGTILQKAKVQGVADTRISEATFEAALKKTNDLEGKVHSFVRFVAACMRSGDQHLVSFANNMVGSYGKSDLLNSIFGWQWSDKQGNVTEQTIYDVQKRVSQAFTHSTSCDWMKNFVPQFLDYRLKIGGTAWAPTWNKQLQDYGVMEWFQDVVPIGLTIVPQPLDVAIVGAGLAGLTVGCALEEHGIKASVYEARNRAGGRVWTKKLDDGSVCEIGATFVDLHHTELAKLCQLLNVPLTAFMLNNTKRLRCVDLQGKPYNIGEKMAEMKSFFTDAKREEIEKMFILNQFFVSAVRPHLSPDAYAALKLGVMDEAGVDIDNIPAPYLWKEIQNAIAFYSYPYDMGERFVMTHGTSSVVDALKKGLDVRYNSELKSVQKDGSNWKLLFADGQSVLAKKVVIAMPLSVLKTIQFDPASGVPAGMLEAVGGAYA